MKKLIDITIASIVGLLILMAGLTRFHHHPSDIEVCFCVDDIAGNSCCAHHDSTHNEPFDSDAETSCPLHIDYFNITECHSDNLLSIHLCHDHHCDICSPEIYTSAGTCVNDHDTDITVSIICDGYDSALSRRGPPAAVA